MSYLKERDRERLNSKLWRINHLYKIINKKGQLVTFKLNYEQEELFKKYQENDKNIGLREYILKDRQIGITTFHVIYYLDEVIWNRGRTAAIIAHEREALEKIFRKVKIALDNMPSPFRPIAKVENKREIVFDDINSSIYIALKVRSGTVNHLHVSELAYISEYKELKAGSFSSVPMDGDITCESTGNGLNGFYKDWHNNKDSTIWDNHFFSWLDHENYVSNANTESTDYDEYLGDISQERKNWWYMKYDELGRDFGLIKQEYPLSEEDAFLHTGKGLFIEEIDKYIVSEEIAREDWATVYKEPIRGRDYCIGADTSIGHKDGDASCFYVMDNRTWEIVMRWHGRIAPDLFGHEIIRWARHYNEAFVGIEENNSGIAVINTVKEEYSNLYQRQRRDKVTEEITTSLGWYTTTKSKDEIIASIKECLREKTVPSIPSQLKDELGTFVITENGNKQALSGFHDDEVMAFGITVMMIKHNPPFDIPEKTNRYMGREVFYNR